MDWTDQRWQQEVCMLRDWMKTSAIGLPPDSVQIIESHLARGENNASRF